LLSNYPEDYNLDARYRKCDDSGMEFTIPTKTVRLNLKNGLSVVTGICVVVLAYIPLGVPADHWTWLRWKVAAVVCGLVAVISLFTQAVIQSSEDHKRAEKEEERDRRDARVWEYFESRKDSMALVSPEAKAPTFDPSLRAEDPRVYAALERTEKRFGEEIFWAPTSAFILRNEGDREALKIQMDSLILFKAKADFTEVACISAHTEARVLPTTTERFEKNDIVRILMSEWDAKGEATAEFVKRMRLTYRDFAGRGFETTFDLVLLPIREIMYRHLPPRRDTYQETLSIRNMEIKPL
jgi:hypothetical protein